MAARHLTKLGYSFLVGVMGSALIDCPCICVANSMVVAVWSVTFMFGTKFVVCSVMTSFGSVSVLALHFFEL